MGTQNSIYDIQLNEEELKLRNGIFNFDTSRFGRIPEIMIKKLYDFQYSKTKDYDLKNKNNKFEVKFSLVKEKEKEKIYENNVLNICLNNSNLTDKTISIKDISNKKFDCNIQQIKPALFDFLYYGLFFNDQIMIFSVSRDIVSNSFSLSNIKNFSNDIKFLIKNCNEIISKKQDTTKKYEKYINTRIKKVNERIEILNDETVCTLIDKTLLTQIKSDLAVGEKKIDSIKKLLKIISDLDKNKIPNVSSKQHKRKKTDEEISKENTIEEGQFHINGKNIEWHIDNTFLGYLSYKDLYKLLQTQKEK